MYKIVNLEGMGLEAMKGGNDSRRKQGGRGGGGAIREWNWMERIGEGRGGKLMDSSVALDERKEMEGQKGRGRRHIFTKFIWMEGRETIG